MKWRRLSILGFVLASIGLAVPSAMAQDATQKQIPLSRADMQLSFAPLVKETTPAVVNVYAARQVQARSPFAGDPFSSSSSGDSSGEQTAYPAIAWFRGDRRQFGHRCDEQPRHQGCR
ncbi:hypothetical protein HED50_05775 [Ochrobactrum oryzae]|nr:hypothetical protein [Brucella oryzae]